MRLPRFSLRDLAIATAIVSAGLGSAVMGFRFDMPAFFAASFVFVGLIYIGGGVLYPFGMQLTLRTSIAFAAAGCIVFVLAVGWQGLRTGSLDGMLAAFVFFLLARFGRVIYKRHEDADQMRLSVMYLVIAMTAMYFAIIGLMYD